MTEPIIICSNCKTKIRLTESLAAPLIAATREQFEQQLSQKDDEIAKRELELTVDNRVQEGIGDVHEKAKREAEKGLKLKVMDKNQTIASMQQEIEELEQKAEQGCQQLRGEVQELELENPLRAKVPCDSIEPVPKGEFGGDVLKRVVSQTGQQSGTILWESKRTKNWSDGWLAKLREDQRTAKAEISVLVSQVLPKSVEAFDVVDGVWVTSPHAALPVATVLPHTLLKVGIARQVSEGQQTKTEMIYQDLTGIRFRHRVEAIMKQWAMREEQIERVMGATVGMYGDLQEITGKSLQEIEALEFPALESETAQAMTNP
jgi:hypothetical protein